MTSELLERQPLAVLFALNGVMCIVEIVSGWRAESMGLIADGLDMGADAAVYLLALLAIGAADARKVGAARFAGRVQLALAILAMLELARRAVVGSAPEPPTMVTVSIVALLVNIACLALLRRHRHGEVHLQAAWIFSATDVQANLGVLLAGALVALLDSPIPDLLIGLVVCWLVLRGAIRIGRRVRAAEAGAPALAAALGTVTLLSACHLPFTRNAAPPRKAVFILLDGIPADVIEQVPTPAIDAIAAAGGYARASVGGELGGPTETPTVSAPGYMSLLTATWANKHNVRGNSNQSPNYAYWNIFRIVESADRSRHTALFSTWLDNRTVLIGEGRPGAGDFRLDHHADGFEQDTVAFPHDPASHYIRAIDERVASEAAAYIASHGPDLTWVYLQHTDDAGHAHGDSEAFHAAVQQADARVGRIWDAVRRRQAMGEAWMIVVTTDHGRDARTGKGHGGQSARERTTWIVTNHPQLDARFSSGSAAIVDITPSILQHLGIAPPPAVAQRMDGVSFLRTGAGRD